MAQFLEQSYAGGRDTKDLAARPLCGLQHFWPELKGHLKRCWRLMRAWQFVTPGSFRRPWPAVLAQAMVAFSLGRDDTMTVVYIMLCFHCLLRPGECCAFRWEDLQFGTGLEYFTFEVAVLAILNPKTQRTGARVQHVTVLQPPILEMLRQYCEKSDHSRPPFANYGSMRSRVTSYLNALLGAGHRYTLGGLRGGGATFLYVQTNDVMLVQRRGRWASLKSLDHYVQEGATLLSVNAWSVEAKFRVSKLAATLPPLFTASAR